MKVALISHSFPPNMTGGIASYTLSLAEALTKKGIDVTVFCGGKVGKEIPHDFKIVRLPMVNFPPRAVWFQLQNFKFLKEELKHFDLIHGQNTSSTFYTLIKKEINKPWVVTFHDCLDENLRIFLESPFYTKNFGDFIFNVIEYPLYKKMYDLDLKNSDKLVPVGYSVFSDLKKYHKFDLGKVNVIRNGIDINQIDKIIKNIPSPRDNKKTRLIFFGRLFYRKGPTFLIGVMQEVIKKNKNVTLDIYGEGPLKKVLERQIIGKNLKDYIQLHNFLPNEEIIKEIFYSDIVILPSLYEAFPLSFLEAMACSKPLVVFDYPFAREIIQNNQNGVLVKPKDNVGLANILIKLIQNTRLRKSISENASKDVRKRFDVNKIVDQYIRLYRQVLKEHNHETIKTKQRKKTK